MTLSLNSAKVTLMSHEHEYVGISAILRAPLLCYLLFVAQVSEANFKAGSFVLGCQSPACSLPPGRVGRRANGGGQAHSSSCFPSN